MGNKSKRKVTDINKNAFFDKKQMDAHLRQPLMRAEAIQTKKAQDMKLDTVYKMIVATWLYLKKTHDIDLKGLSDFVGEFTKMHESFTGVLKEERSADIVDGRRELSIDTILEACKKIEIGEDEVEVLFGIRRPTEEEKAQMAKEEEDKAKLAKQFPDAVVAKPVPKVAPAKEIEQTEAQKAEQL